MVSISSPSSSMIESSSPGYEIGDHWNAMQTSKSFEYSDTEEEDQDHYGDYSTRMEELFSDRDDEEGSSIDGATHSRSNSLNVSSASYGTQLRDVLGSEHSGDDMLEEEEELEVEGSLLHPDDFLIDSLHLTVPETVSCPRVYLTITFLSAYGRHMLNLSCRILHPQTRLPRFHPTKTSHCYLAAQP